MRLVCSFQEVLLAFFLCSAQMLAIRQSAETTPEFSDWLNMKVSVPEISLHVSFITRGDTSSAPSDFLESKPERSLQTPGEDEVTSNVGMSG